MAQTQTDAAWNNLRETLETAELVRTHDLTDDTVNSWAAREVLHQAADMDAVATHRTGQGLYAKQIHRVISND